MHSMVSFVPCCSLLTHRVEPQPNWGPRTSTRLPELSGRVTTDVSGDLEVALMRCCGTAVALLLAAIVHGKSGGGGRCVRGKNACRAAGQRAVATRRPSPPPGALASLQAGVYVLEIEPATRGCFAKGTGCSLRGRVVLFFAHPLASFFSESMLACSTQAMRQPSSAAKGTRSAQKRLGA